MRKGFRLLLILTLLLCMASTAFADDSISNQGVTRIGEENDLREANSETYLLSDGSYECVVYPCDKYFVNSRAC